MNKTVTFEQAISEAALMQILFTYTKLPIYKRLDGSAEEFDAPTPTIERFDRDGKMKRVEWVQTGLFVDCNGCIVFQWRGTFDHEREAADKQFQASLKQHDAWKDDLLESEGPPIYRADCPHGHCGYCVYCEDL